MVTCCISRIWRLMSRTEDLGRRAFDPHEEGLVTARACAPASAPSPQSALRSPRDVSKVATGAFFTEEAYPRGPAGSTSARVRAKRQLFKAVGMAGRNTAMTTGKTSE